LSFLYWWLRKVRKPYISVVCVGGRRVKGWRMKKDDKIMDETADDTLR
jgi:hypothetical protein